MKLRVIVGLVATLGASACGSKCNTRAEARQYSIKFGEDLRAAVESGRLKGDAIDEAVAKMREVDDQDHGAVCDRIDQLRSEMNL